MSARLLAQEASSWYLAHLDESSSNAENVQNYLRRPVLALTLKILVTDEAVGLEKSLNCLEIEDVSSVPPPPKENGAGARRNGSSIIGAGDWREHLRRSSTLEEDDEAWNKKDDELYGSLERRAKARLDAFLEGCALAVHSDPLNSSQRGPTKGRQTGSKLRIPTRPGSMLGRELSLNDALSGYSVPLKTKGPNGAASPTLAAIQPATEMLRQLSNSSSGQVLAYAQFRAADLTTRLELYLRSLTRVRVSGKECVVALEPPRAVKARVHALVKAFVSTVGCVRSMSPVLTKLLKSLTRELLAVDTLGDDVAKVIRHVVSEYEKQTSFASLAFLSSPEESAEKILTPLVLTFVEYLQLNWECLVAESDLERMLSTVLDGQMRHLLKTIEFRSIGHLLEVCQGFRTELQRIELPPNIGGIQCKDVTARCMDPDAIRQAVRDLQRETITVNGHILPPVRNRRELVTLLSETLNSRTFMHEKRKNLKGKLRKVHRSESCPAAMTEIKSRSEDHDTDDFVSSGNEGDTDGSVPRRRDEGTDSGRKRPKRRSFQLRTVDMMTRRLLIAASRTGMGGDAFFIVKDLFGDDDVEVVPSKAVQSYGKVARGGTIEIMVRLTSVTIKCHGSFDVYPKPVESFQEPLIQLHTTTSETIYLQEVRAGDTSGEITPNLDSGSDDSDCYPKRSVLVLQEKKTERTGWRTLSIRPALYEVVEELNTPS